MPADTPAKKVIAEDAPAQSGNRRSFRSFKFNDKAIRELQPEATQFMVFDSETRGLACIVYPSGKRSLVWYRKVGRAPMKIILGAFGDLSITRARIDAELNNGKLGKWKDDGMTTASPFSARPEETTFEDVFEAYVARYLKLHARKPESAEKAARWLYKYGLKDSLGARRVASFRRNDLTTIHAKLAEQGRVLANRAVQLARRVFRWGLREQMYSCPVDPFAGFKMFPEESRTRFLQKDEMYSFFDALKNETNESLRHFVWLSLATGARRSDLLSAKWADIDSDMQVWRIPAPKNGRAYSIPLSAEAREVLKERKALTKDSEFLFPADSTTGHAVNLQKAWVKFRDRAGLPDLHIHDLRRSLGSWQAGAGSSILIIGKSLGHTSAAATQIYSRVDLSAVLASTQNAIAQMKEAGKTKPKPQLKAATNA